MQEHEPIDLANTLRLFRHAQDTEAIGMFQKPSFRPRDDLDLMESVNHQPMNAWHFSGQLSDGTVGHVVAIYRHGDQKNDPAVRISLQRFDSYGNKFEWRLGSAMALQSVHDTKRLSPQERESVVDWLKGFKKYIRLPEPHEFPENGVDWELPKNEIRRFIRELRL